MIEQLDLGLEAPVPGPGAPDRAGPAAAPPDTGAPPPPSDEQRAILEFATDLVVTAAAGSGKTRTLVDLYAALMAEPGRLGPEPLRPGEILCLTFTERAAREIQGRVRERIADPALLRELETAPIGTFHGWCAGLLRDHPLEAGVDPRFAVLSEEAADDLLRGSAVETLRRGLQTGDEPARIAVEILGLGAAAARLAELVRDIRTAGWSDRDVIARFEARLEEVAAEAAGPLAGAVDRSAAELLALVEGSLKTPTALGYLRDFHVALEAWGARRADDSAAGLAAAARAPSHSWKGVKGERHAVLAAIDEWAAARLELDRALQLGAWPALVTSVRAGYRVARAARAALDYDDLLLRSRDLLTGHAEVLEAVRSRHRVILVDEHQDTDPVQDAILRLLLGDAVEGRPGGAPRRGPRWCVVGDARQSIYGFRGATVEAFAALARDAEARGAHRSLAFNYRSRGELIAFHNAFFPRVLTAGPHAPSLAYVAQRAFRPAAPGPAVELLAPAADGGPAAEAREIEARALAARIRAACDPADPGAVTVWEDGRRRAAGPGDVVILMRKLTQVEPYRRALQAVGIETIVTGSGEFYGRQEVFDVLNALEAALAPEDPVPLIAFLRSPMVGLSDESVWRLLRDRDRGAPLWPQALARAATAGLEPDQAARLGHARAVLDGLRSRADREPPGAVVAWLVDRTGYAAVLDAVPDREQRRANLERLVALADRGPAEGAGLLADWAAALRRRVKRPPRERDASPPEAGERVLILSIHQAKGLEFPVVALADLGGTTPGGLGGVAFDPALGVVARVWEDPAAVPAPTRSYAEAARRRKERERAEEARLLYVAATRARDRLILSAGSGGGWWLPEILDFAAGEGAAHVAVSPLEEWAARHAAGAAVEPEPPGPGVERLAPTAAAPGEATARELAAAAAGAAALGSGSRSTRPGPLPAIAREAARAATARGRRGHATLERLPIELAGGTTLRDWLAGPAALPPEEVEPLARFVERAVLPALGRATRLERERPFRLRLPGGGGVSGAIDCLWQDAEGRWHVWDYKFADPDADPDGAHERQLAVYALAAAAALGLEEVRGALWYVGTGSARSFAWDREALAALEAELDAAFPRLGDPTVGDDDG